MSNCCEARVKSITKPLFALYEKYLRMLNCLDMSFWEFPPLTLLPNQTFLTLMNLIQYHKYF